MRSSQIYVINADPSFRASLECFLVAAGFGVNAFGSVPSFLGWVDYDDLPRDVCVLTDLYLPEMSGLDLLDVLAADEVTLPTVVMTTDVSSAVDSMRSGASHCIQKPFDNADLLSVLNQVFARQRVADAVSCVRSTNEAVRERIASLSPRQREILMYVFEGKLNKTIAGLLGISIKTVELHRARMMEKMQAGSLAELIRMTAQCGNSSLNSH